MTPTQWILWVVVPLVLGLGGAVLVFRKEPGPWRWWVLSGLLLVAAVGGLRGYAAERHRELMAQRLEPTYVFTPDGGLTGYDFISLLVHDGRLSTPFGYVDVWLVFVPAFVLVLVGALSGRRTVGEHSPL